MIIQQRLRKLTLLLLTNQQKNALIAELSTLTCLFVTQHMKQFIIVHAQSHRMCRFESTLLQHLLSWCCYHGFSLRYGLKKTAARKSALFRFLQKQVPNFLNNQGSIQECRKHADLYLGISPRLGILKKSTVDIMAHFSLMLT